MKKYSDWELSIIKKYFKKEKIPKSISDIDKKILVTNIDHNIRILLELAVTKIAKNEDISLIVHSIIQYEKYIDEKKHKNNSENRSLRSIISEDLIDDEALSKLELKALKEVLEENKSNVNIDYCTPFNNKEEKKNKIK